MDHQNHCLTPSAASYALCRPSLSIYFITDHINCRLWSLVMTGSYTVGEISSLTQTSLYFLKISAFFGLIWLPKVFPLRMISLSFNKPQPKIYWNSARNRGEEQRERENRKKMKGGRNGRDKAKEGNIKLLRTKSQSNLKDRQYTDIQRPKFRACCVQNAWIHCIRDLLVKKERETCSLPIYSHLAFICLSFYNFMCDTSCFKNHISEALGLLALVSSPPVGGTRGRTKGEAEQMVFLLSATSAA